MSQAWIQTLIIKMICIGDMPLTKLREIMKLVHQPKLNALSKTSGAYWTKTSCSHIFREFIKVLIL